MSNVVELKQPAPNTTATLNEKDFSAEILFAWNLGENADFAAKDGLLHQWNGTCWLVLSDDEAERLALAWLASHTPKSATASKAIAAVATAAKTIQIVPKTTKDKTIIPTLDSYITIDDCGIITTAKPDKNAGITYSLSCAYMPDALCPKFDAFIESVLPDAAVRSLVQEYIGYTLMPDARFQKAQMWLGGGSNGKGATAEIVQALHGKTAAVNLAVMDKFALTVLFGASLAYADETPLRGIDEQRLKTMISGDLLYIDRKNRDGISYRNTAKLIAAANAIPTTADQSEGFWRRFHIIPFTQHFPDSSNDPLLARNIIKNEMPGVLNWAIEGLARLLQRGRFPSLPDAVTAATTAGKTATNSVKAWASDIEIETGEQAKNKKDAVYTRYATWCKSNGMSAVASIKFWERLRAILPDITEWRPAGSDRSRMVNIFLPTEFND